MNASELIPELVAPAGSFEKLKTAVLYGADAVYLAGQKFGLRTAAENFTDFELKKGVEFAHTRGVKVYAALNAFLHDEDLSGLEKYYALLESVGVDGVIASDPGVVGIAKESSNLHIHLSTQASCLNSYSARLWKKLGVKRIVVGRELSIEEASRIRQDAGVEIEMFIHGAMCMSYSGRCTISNFTAGRDSNRGGCIQSCRFNYKMKRADPTKLFLSSSSNTIPADECHFMSSKDLNGLSHLEDFCRHGIDAIKIEGRMKSPFYLAETCKTYRKALDLIKSGKSLQEGLESADFELKSFPHRDYCSGSLTEPAGKTSVLADGGSSLENASHSYIGTVIERMSDGIAVRLLAPVKKETSAEIVSFKGDNTNISFCEMQSVKGTPLKMAKQDSVIYIPVNSLGDYVQAGCIIRATVKKES